MRRRAATILLLSWLGLWWVSSAPAPASAASEGNGTIVSLRLEGVVDPIMASYVRGGIEQANSDGAPAVLITIDTPGGLDSSMREMITAILGSKVPVICYTSPSGARAASAGAFVMEACPVAAMAPGTNIGAAHPVGVSGAIELAKVTNDAAAFIRSLAERWGRNADWAERAVRDSVAVSAEEAGRLRVVDVIASTTGSLLNRVGGCSGETASGAPASGLLHSQAALPGVCGAALEPRGLGFGAAVLHRLIDPSLSFLFFYAGLVLIIVELLHPGISVPGILGVLFLLAAFMSFGFLPVELGGIVLLVASAVFFLLELKHPGIGAPTVAGVITLVLGGTLLFNPSVPNARVSIWLLLGVALALAAFFAVVVRAVLAAKDLPRPGGLEDLVGENGVATSDLSPSGHVRARGEQWTAESTGPRIGAGEAVRIVRVKGLRLFVEPAQTGEGEPARRPGLAAKGGRR